MPRARWSAAVALSALVALSACGGDDDDAATLTDTAADATTTTLPVTTTAPVTTAPPTTAPVTTAPATTAPATTAPPTSAPATAPTTAPGGIWQDPAGVFQLAFPVTPTEQQLAAPLPDGTTLPVIAYLAELEGAAAIASCVVYPSGTVVDPTTVLDAARDGALTNVGAELADSEPIELQGRPGVAYRGAIGEAGAVLGRTFLDGLQLCQVLVVGEPTIVDSTGPALLDSFAFLKEVGA